MSYSSISHPINSKSWWEEYHSKYWDACHGSSQTAHFMERLLEGRAPVEREFLKRGNLDILGWGCAFSEGVVCLVRAFSGCSVAGLDYLEQAIKVARSRYTGLKFIQNSEGSIPRAFDVIVTSNCLEHFADPLAIVSSHLLSCRDLYIALVPYREEPLCDFHAVRFYDDTFPERLEDFQRIGFRVIETEAQYWPGPQLLVVYASPRYLTSRRPDRIADRERAKWDAYYATVGQAGDEPSIDQFGEKFSKLVEQLLPNGGRILEAGAGGDQQSMALARTGKFELTLMDFSAEALEQAQRWFGRGGVVAQFVHQDVMLAGAAGYDLVFNAGVLEHYTHQEQVALLQGMASRSRRYVLVLVPNRLCYWYWIRRLAVTGEGSWPYGKEIPIADLGGAFEAADLRPLGQLFTASSWTENFIRNLPGVGVKLRDQILLAHQSAVIPEWQKGYLLVGLACKRNASNLVVLAAFQVSGWPRTDLTNDTTTATLADALALGVAAENRLAVREAFFAGQLVQGQMARPVEDAARQVPTSPAAAEVRGTDEERAASERFVMELEQRTNDLEAEIARVLSSRTYRVANRLRRVRMALQPVGSRREQAARLAVRALRKACREARSLVERLARWLVRRLASSRHSWAATWHSLTAPRRREPPPRIPGGEPPAVAGFPCIPGLVSVVLPVYNQAALLAESIDSVLSQTYPDLELIVVDDGSTDGFESVLARYAGCPRVRVLTQTNQKLPAALSHGFRFARGEFWTWTSADNRMDPEQLSVLVAFLHAHPETAMVYADYRVIDDHGDPLTDPDFRPQNRITPRSPMIHLPRSTRELNVVSDNFIGPCFLYRGWVGRLMGQYDPSMGVEDYDYWMRINGAFQIDHLGEYDVLYEYRVHQNSLSHQLYGKPISELCEWLIAHERARTEYSTRPWTIHVDDTVKSLADETRFEPHEVISWSPDRSTPEGADGPARDGCAGELAPKVMFLLDSRSLNELSRSVREPQSIVVCAFDSIESVYENRVEARHLVDLAVVDDPAIAQRLELLGVDSLVVGGEYDPVDLAIKFANNRAFFQQVRSESMRKPKLPSSLPVAGRQWVLIQVNDLDQGGLENAVLNLARGLATRGFEPVLLVLGRQGTAAAQARRAGLEILELPRHERERHYRTFLEQRRIALVSAHFSVFGASIAAELGVPFVQVVHNTYVWLGPKDVDTCRSADRFTSAYVCVSGEVARYCDRNLGLSVEKMVLISNGIDLQALEAARGESPGQLRQELGLQESDFVILNVASIHPTKAQVPLVRAWESVIRDNPGAKLVLVGSVVNPRYQRRVERQVKASNLGRNVILAGHREDVARFYWMADAFILPSFWEGWSLALSEAACAGLPLVATDVGGARELLKPLGGRLIKPPFGTITELDHTNIGRVVRGDDARFQARLTFELRLLTETRGRRCVPDSVKSMLDLERVHDAHAQLYRWLIQGGSAAGARPWAHELGLR